MKIDDDLLSKEQAAQFIGVSIQTLYNWRSQGLRYYKVGGRVRYKKDDLLKFAEPKENYDNSNTLQNSE